MAQDSAQLATDLVTAFNNNDWDAIPTKSDR